MSEELFSVFISNSYSRRPKDNICDTKILMKFEEEYEENVTFHGIIDMF